MAIIHPSSVVRSQVQLADDVQIGPGCVIEGQVSIARGTRLIGHVYVGGRVTIGENNVLYPFTTLGMEPQDRKYKPGDPSGGVLIGNNNFLRESVTIHRATGARPTTLGNDNFLMCNSHLGHDVVVGNCCTFANGVALGGHVHVQDQVTIGGNTVVHQFVRLGRLCMLSGGIALAQDVAPFCTAYNIRQVESLNLVGLRRAGHRDHIANLQKAFRILFKSGHSIRNALDQVEATLGRDPLCREMIEFCRATKRGITDCRPSAGDVKPELAGLHADNGDGMERRMRAIW